jgi:hypothetical protein
MNGILLVNGRAITDPKAFPSLLRIAVTFSAGRALHNRQHRPLPERCVGPTQRISPPASGR